jgi:RHS repeat-associated protein
MTAGSDTGRLRGNRFGENITVGICQTFFCLAAVAYFEYDAWGRMSRKYMGSSGSPTFEATYEYKYDDKLVAVSSNFPDEGNVTYEYGGDGQRRSRTAGGVTTYLNWGPMGPLSEQNSSGALTESYVGIFASVSGSNPASGSYEYFLRDANSSVRSTVDGSFLVTAQSAYDPYGGVIDETGVMPAFVYTGHWREELTGMYFAYHRVLDPATARWLRREPTGADGPNSYRYALNNPVSFYDPDGLSAASVFVSWFGGHRGDWFDRMAEWTGRCLGPPSGLLLGLTAPIALIERLGAAELVLLGDINKSWYAPLGKAYPSLVDNLGKGAGISVGFGVGIADLFFDPFDAWTDRMMGLQKVKCPWD